MRIGSRDESDRQSHNLRTRKKKMIEINYDLALNFNVYHGDGIEDPTSNPGVQNRIYCVVFSVAPGVEYHTHPVVGFPDPVWRQSFRIGLHEALDNYAFINVEVMRLHSKSDPGSSDGITVVGRARIPLPSMVSTRKEGRFGLVRQGDNGFKAEGHIVVSMEFEKVHHMG
ncbi:hypothetical protein ACOSQ3_032948 [Xanthoceras sorbifolium]